MVQTVTAHEIGIILKTQEPKQWTQKELTQEVATLSKKERTKRGFRGREFCRRQNLKPAQGLGRQDGGRTYTVWKLDQVLAAHANRPGSGNWKTTRSECAS